MTRSHMKKAKRGGYTPWDFLRVGLSVYEGEPSIELTPNQAGTLFREYSHSFQGMSQLFWTKDLKGFLFDGSYDGDYELARSIDKSASYFAGIDLDIWRIVVSKELRQRVLDVCSDGKSALLDYLQSLKDIPPSR